MGIEKIKEKILGDAKKEADKITKQAEKQAKEITDKNKMVLDALTKRKEQEIQAAATLFRDKTLAQARLDIKRKYLAKREEIIQGFIGEALQGIQKTKDYEAYLKKEITESSKLLGEDIIIKCNKADEKLVTGIVGSEIKVQKSDLESGVIIQDASGKKIDLTVITSLESSRQKISQEVVKVLGA